MLLSLLVFLPVLAMLLLFVIPDGQPKMYRYITLGVCSIQLALASWLFFSFSSGTGALHSETSWFLQERMPWIFLDLGLLGKLNIEYFLALDGLNIYLVLLTSIVMLCAAWVSWSIKQNRKGFYALFLLMCSTVYGTFIAMDLFLFYLFFELMLLPMYFLIGIWGGENREYASVKFLIYTIGGSLLILMVLIAAYFSVIDPLKTAAYVGQGVSAQDVQLLLSKNQLHSDVQVHTLNISYLTDQANYIPGSVLHALSSPKLWLFSIREWSLLFLLVGFLIKLPSFPFHTWLPDAHVEAPTPVSVVLAGILLKIGGYGMLRLALPLFPVEMAHFSYVLAFLGAFTIAYAAMNALAMSDIKKLIAYSSVSHMGFVTLGIASLTVEGIHGAVYQMFSHGLISSLLFILAGVLYDRTHDRTISHYRGLASVMPKYAIFVTVAFFASLGLPGFSGFIAELFSLLGAYAGAMNGHYSVLLVIVAVIGILITGGYYVWTLQRMFMGKYSYRSSWTRSQLLEDLSPKEFGVQFFLVVLIILFGLMPSLLMDKTSTAINALTELIK
ncbi:MAG: proton-translocating NADH-quinone oxidoreductase, chain [Cytophagaceae bacterium]|jgi:NADH-quinone oxidoreductase subunit M|nr:proton-translocating NADH-quinone oxidoreductase, chain [Cytophagaceae bacterium]